MTRIVATFSGFSVADLETGKQFYREVLGCKTEDTMGGASLTLPDGRTVWMYAKPDHQPASYTMLNLVVTDITAAVDELTAKGVAFEQYDGFEQDERGIAWGKKASMGPNIAWFKDPAGNILSILEE